MTNYIAKCGCDCLNCPTHSVNLRSVEDKRSCCAGFEKYLDMKISPERIRPCDGCSIPDPERKVYYLNCRIRVCAMLNGMENCAWCEIYPCGELLQIQSFHRIKSRQDYIEKTGKEISEKDYRVFIEPYLGINHLDRIRQKLQRKDYKEYQKFNTEARFLPFQSKEIENSQLKKIRRVITSVCIENNVSYARMITLEEKREQIMRILFTAGIFGLINRNINSLEVPGSTFLSHKIDPLYNHLNEYFDELKKQGIYADIITTGNNSPVLPSGEMKNDGWYLRMKFIGEPADIETIVSLKEYCEKLNAVYRNKAFRMFKMAEMNCMTSCGVAV